MIKSPTNYKYYLWNELDSNYDCLINNSTTYLAKPVLMNSTFLYLAIGISNIGSYFGALKGDGSLWTWGSNNVGQLGLGNTINTTIPNRLGTSTWKSIGIHQAGMHAIRADGTLWGWGWGDSGVRGDGTTTTTQATPIQIGTSTWKFIRSDANRTKHAIRADDTLWTWGWGEYGARGDGTTTSTRATPIQIGTSTWKFLSNGPTQTMHAIRADGTLWGWGRGDFGARGNGTTTTTQATPIQIGTSTWKFVSGDVVTYHAIRADDTLWAWGRGLSGTRGDGTTTTTQATPIQIGTSTWKFVLILGTSRYGLSEGKKYRWGNPFYMPDSPSEDILVPTLFESPPYLNGNDNRNCHTTMRFILDYNNSPSCILNNIR
jgi:alpha-tubulin suppressor-like RCC1 family protein